MPDEPLDLSARMHEEQRHRLFPRDALPVEFSDLYSQWVEYDDFVAGLAMSVLRGRSVSREDLGPFKAWEFRDLLERLRQKDPKLAERYVAEFEFLDKMLDLIWQIVRTRRAGEMSSAGEERDGA